MVFARKYINIRKDIDEEKRTSYTIPIEWLNEIKILMMIYSEELEMKELRYKIIKEEDRAVIKLERKLFNKFDLEVFSKEFKKGRRRFYYDVKLENTIDMIWKSKEFKNIVGEDSLVQVTKDIDEISILIIKHALKGLDDFIH